MTGLRIAGVHPCKLRHYPLDCHCNSGANSQYRRGVQLTEPTGGLQVINDGPVRQASEVIGRSEPPPPQYQHHGNVAAADEEQAATRIQARQVLHIIVISVSHWNHVRLVAKPRYLSHRQTLAAARPEAAPGGELAHGGGDPDPGAPSIELGGWREPGRADAAHRVWAHCGAVPGQPPADGFAPAECRHGAALRGGAAEADRRAL